MTSPAQLKYLDAMEIPVWVSRELVSKQKLNINVTDGVSIGNNAKTLITNKISNKQANSSAQNILNSLEDTSKIRQPLMNAVSASVKRTKIPNESKSTKLEVKGDNLVFKSPNHYVFASGSDSAGWMVIGHSPETFNGIGHEPFAGEAGELLVNMIRAVGIENPRRQAYMVNVFDINYSAVNKESNDKLKTEIISLIKQVNPKIVLIVGQIAAQNLLQVDDPLIIIRSKIHFITDSKIPCVVTYYPSYLLQKTIDKRKAWDDLKLAMSAIADVS